MIKLFNCVGILLTIFTATAIIVLLIELMNEFFRKYY
jgi:hypothetical protein